jgi:hypothetical protein
MHRRRDTHGTITMTDTSRPLQLAPRGCRIVEVAGHPTNSNVMRAILPVALDPAM